MRYENNVYENYSQENPCCYLYTLGDFIFSPIFSMQVTSTARRCALARAYKDVAQCKGIFKKEHALFYFSMKTHMFDTVQRIGEKKEFSMDRNREQRHTLKGDVSSFGLSLQVNYRAYSRASVHTIAHRLHYHRRRYTSLMHRCEYIINKYLIPASVFLFSCSVHEPPPCLVGFQNNITYSLFKHRHNNHF